ncbi:MAG: methionyl-tRNA formyltransferase [Balneolaceae bacterium]|nr:methionyl-tRNA formyltransferase [Balneolaceae bacterium]MDR9409592.1 methionyl-tRNA formyltransferase [Balneolaceae bacterium]
MRSLNIVFMGSPDFAIPSLENIHQTDHNILAVVSNPDKRRGRGRKPEPTPVKKKADELNLPTIDVEDLNSDSFHDQLVDLKPDLFVVVAFRILPLSILEIPTIGSVNLHASLLPKYRGAAPIHWAIINGEKETGCTVFFLDEKVDTGKIIGQSRTVIDLLETTGDLYNRLKESGADLLVQSINQIAEGSVEATPQNHELASPAPKLFKENTRIDFNKPANEVHNFIRGLSPFPTAWCTYDGKKMNIYRSKPTGIMKLKPGELHFRDAKLFVGCRTGAIEIVTLQLPGTKRMSGKDFANGYDLNHQLE